jgi:hypothetical protein
VRLSASLKSYSLHSIFGETIDPKSWLTGKIENNEFHFDEFVEVLFPFQPSMRTHASTILKYLREKGPASLNQIIVESKLTRGTAYDTVRYLKRWGLIERNARYAPLKLSKEFSKVLRKIGDYWDTYSQAQTPVSQTTN